MGAQRYSDGGWWLDGEAIVALVRRHGIRSTLPPGISALPAAAPMVVIASRFEGAPGGPISELAVAELARCGSHLGWCRTLVVSDRRDVERAQRGGWERFDGGASLEWLVEGRIRRMRWAEGGVEVTGSIGPTRLPWVIPQRVLQRRGGEAVVVPTRLRGLMHPGVVRVSAGSEPMRDEPGGKAEAVAIFNSLSGGHIGAVVTGLRTLARPARVAHHPGVARPPRGISYPEPALRDRCEVGAGAG